MKCIFIWNILILITLNGYAQIEGEIVDGKSKGIPNAIIIATDSLTNNADTARSDRRGFYYFKSLKPGNYKLSTSAPGFISESSKYIIITTAPAKADAGDDTYYAIRYDLVLRLKE